MFTAPDEYKGRTHLVKHQIRTTSDIPIRKNPYRVSLKERKIIGDQINSMLKNGIISHSSSPWASPIILVKKKNGTFRFCVDYRNLNSVTVKDQYPLPRIDDCFDSLHGARYFTSLDLCSGYWQVEVEEQDREKTAFITPDGHYQFNVLPFGLCNGPATFERLMDTVLRTHKWKICLCYLDDVIIFSEDLHSHLNRLKTILECLKTAGLTLNASKCRFAYTKLLILGHVVSNEGIAPDPEKIISIRKFPTPRTVKDVRAFLGLCSYYRRFIIEFSKIALALQILTRKNHSFAWGKEQELSFNSLKNKLISPEVLIHYDPNKPIGLHTDASDQGLGAVLVHLDENTKERPISYASRTLQKAETNYSTTEKECLAIIWAIKKFRPYFYGRKFTIYTDHHSLCWMAKMKNPAGRLARWSLELQEYDFAIKYKSGKTHLDADGLSRCPIPDRIISTINYEEHDYDSYIKKIDNLVNQNPNSYGENFTKFKEKLFKKNPSVTGDPWLLIVPKNKQKELLENMHDHPTSGHMGIKRTYNRLKSKYFWPSMLKTVEEYVFSCPGCQFRKTPSQLPQGLLQPIPPASRPFEKMGIDLMGRFPKSGRGNSWILVCTDYYSRYIETAALPRGTAEEIADFFLQRVVLRHGAPKTATVGVRRIKDVQKVLLSSDKEIIDILAEDDEADLEKEMDDCADYQEIIFEAIVAYEDAQKQVAREVVVQDSFPDTTKKIRLPTIELPKFSGSLKEWSDEENSMLVMSMNTMFGDSRQDFSISQLWDLDTIGVRDPVEVKSSVEQETAFKNEFLKNISRNKDGRYVVPLPWIEGHPPLPTNEIAAHKRLVSTTRKLKTSKEMEDPQPLTPAMFLRHKGNIKFPEGDLTEKDRLQFSYAWRKSLERELKNRFRSEYLSHLINKNKGKNSHNLRIGDIVVIGSDLRKRTEWPLGRIKELPTWIMQRGLELADLLFHIPAPIDIILDADMYANLMHGEKKCCEGTGPIAMKSKLGWILMGKVDSSLCRRTIK
ncbi:K02A2.6-like, partial [Cordylochernes scorpioides]